MRISTAPRGIEPIGTPAENLAAFVALALASTNFGTDLDFYASRWDVTGHTRERPGLLSGRRSVGFDPWRPRGKKVASRKTRTAAGSRVQGAPPSVDSLNRAFVRLMRYPSHSQMKIECVTGSLLAEAMKRLGVKDVADITPLVLNKAAKIADLSPNSMVDGVVPAQNTNPANRAAGCREAALACRLLVGAPSRASQFLG